MEKQNSLAMKSTTKLSFTILIIVTFSFTQLYAQTFEEFKKQRQQELQQFKNDRQKQMQQLAEEFNKYVEKQDREFADYLKQRWQQYQIFQGIEPPEEPKPDIAPVFKLPERPAPPNPIPVKKPAIDQPGQIVPEPVLPRITRPEPDDFPVQDKNFIFYGFPVSFDFDENMTKIQINGNPDENAISETFDRLSTINYNHLLEQFYNYSNLLNLNDWGYYCLLKQASESFTETNENTQKLLTWFLLIRSGYKARIAFYDQSIYLLLPINNQVYDVKFFNFDGVKYYLLDGEVSNIYTYKKDFPEAQKTFDLNLYKSLSLGDEVKTRVVDFEYNDQNFQLPIEYNKNLISFYNDYPLSDIKLYFDAMVSPEAKSSLTVNFAPLISGKSEIDAVNMLLHFVQTGFEYQTDQEQFGYEKFFFAEEAFNYPYCDCEDRSVLFAYLVQSLTGLDVIGLNYPGHIATAVCFNEDVSGDYFEFEGKKYVMADPTYINAPAGLTMPDYKNQQAEIIMLENKYATGREKDNLWDEIIAAGGNRADNGRDMIVNEDGTRLITGYFNNSFKYKNIDVAGNNKPSMFAMMLNVEKQPLWFSSSKGNGLALAYNLAIDHQQNYYITGTFEGNIEIDGTPLKNENEKPDIFLAKYNDHGQLVWLKNADIDTANAGDKTENNYLNFLISFDKDGVHLRNELYFESGDFKNYGISIAASGEILVAGAFNKTTGMNKMTFNTGGSFDAVEALKAENDKLISESYEKTIAGLFAVVQLVQNSGLSIPGSAAREVLDKYNPEFKKEFPEIFNAILKINFLKNQDGIVVIKTENSKELPIDMMRVSDNARLKISMLESGDARIDVLSGVRVGKAFWWYSLNHILLYKNNGDLLFDYDVDHEVAVKNLKVDILY